MNSSRAPEILTFQICSWHVSQLESLEVLLVSFVSSITLFPLVSSLSSTRVRQFSIRAIDSARFKKSAGLWMDLMRTNFTCFLRSSSRIHWWATSTCFRRFETFGGVRTFRQVVLLRHLLEVLFTTDGDLTSFEIVTQIHAHVQRHCGHNSQCELL